MPCGRVKTYTYKTKYLFEDSGMENAFYDLHESNFLDTRLAFLVSRHFVVMGDFVDVAERIDEFFVVCNDNKHKVLLSHSLLDDLTEGSAETSHVFLVQVGCWLIES